MQRRNLVISAAAVLAVTSVFVGAQVVSGQSAAQETVFVPIVPCRLVDTRPALNVGPVNTPLGREQTRTFTAWETGDGDSDCAIPTTATAVASNITAVTPTAETFITAYPADADNPGTSNLNVVGGANATPNSANVPLSTDGKFNIFNNRGTVDIVIDINGYYQPSSATGSSGGQGPVGPRGPAGPKGDAGATGPRGATGAQGPAGEDGTDGVNGVDGGVDGNSVTTIAATGSVGRDTSTAIGTNGNPIISYYNASAGDLEVAACGNPTCTTSTITKVDSNGNVGANTSIAIRPNGNPIMSYRDVGNGDLKVAACSDPRCVETPTVTGFDNNDAVGFFTSIAIGANGNAIISHNDDTNGDLEVASCNNSDCTTATATTVTSAGDVGLFTSIAIGADGNPIISYYDDTNGDLAVATCANTTCTTSSNRTVDTGGDVGEYTSITIGSNDFPIISYRSNGTERDLKVASCANATCTGSAAITTVDSSGSVGVGTSITIGEDGNPVISYEDGSASNRALLIAACTTPTCSNAVTSSIDSSGIVGRDSSIVIGVDARPFVAYSDLSNADLKGAACGSPTCEPFGARNR